jgi:DNA-binding response OmpR family regulator
MFISSGKTSPYFGDPLESQLRDDEKVPIVLVAAKEDIFSQIRDALADSNLALLAAETTHAAIALVERLKSEFDLAIIELELPDFGAWDLLRQLHWQSQRLVKIIAITSLYFEPELDKELDVTAVVPKALPPEEWRRTVEAVLGMSENTC